MHPAWVINAITQFIRQFCDAPWTAWIGAASLAGLGGQPSGRLWREGGRYTIMAGVPLHEGFVWMPSDPGQVPELWLSPHKTGYRNLFERFAQRHLGAAGLSGADVQIDHVFPKRAAALGELAYVRMLAIPPPSNMLAGATLERQMVARNLVFGPRGKRTRLATFFSIGKATGFVGYDGLPDDDAALNHALAQALFAHLRIFGLPPDVLTALDQRLTAQSAAKLR